MRKIWILAANREIARFFSLEGGKNSVPTEISDLIDPSARLYARDLETDRPGRQAASSNGSHHGVEKKRGVKEEARSRFATRIADALNTACHGGQFERLYLMAEPRMLGELRTVLDKETVATVAGEVAANLVKSSPKEIRSHLPDFP